MADKIKSKKTQFLTKLTRTPRNASILIESVWSRTTLASYLPDLDKVPKEQQEANEKFAACLAAEEEKSKAAKCYSEAESQYEQAMAWINEHLISRKDEAPPVVSGVATGWADEPLWAVMRAAVLQMSRYVFAGTSSTSW